MLGYPFIKSIKNFNFITINIFKYLYSNPQQERAADHGSRPDDPEQNNTSTVGVK